jgi:hypothetical protein
MSVRDSIVAAHSRLRRCCSSASSVTGESSLVCGSASSAPPPLAPPLALPPPPPPPEAVPTSDHGFDVGLVRFDLSLQRALLVLQRTLLGFQLVDVVGAGLGVHPGRRGGVAVGHLVGAIVTSSRWFLHATSKQRADSIDLSGDSSQSRPSTSQSAFPTLYVASLARTGTHLSREQNGKPRLKRKDN